jgi:hypothetical protein
VVIGLLAVVALSSCSTTPTAYSGKIRKTFVESCSTTTGGTSIPAKVCGCVYDKFKKAEPFKEFKKLQDDLRSKKKPLDELGPAGRKMVGYLDTCQQQS